MIKVIEGYSVKKGKDISPLLFKIRTAALTYPGYITGESLQGFGDSSHMVVSTTWQSIEAWHTWEHSRIRAMLHEEFEAMLFDNPQVTVYTIMPTQRWG